MSLPAPQLRMLSRWTALAAVGCFAVALVRAVVRRRPVIHAVLPELRSPLLYLPLPPRGVLGLWLIRRILGPETQPQSGVDLSLIHI